MNTFKTLAILLLAFPAATLAAQHNNKSWQFKVYLDDREIGYHNYQLQQTADRKVMISEASFNATFLLVYNYTYEHSNYEIWQDGCLHTIASVTNDDGDSFSVNGKQLQGSFQLAVHKQTTKLQSDIDRCVRSFAYWDPELLAATKLLNPQTGEYLSVELVPLPTRTMLVNNRTVTARGYRLTTRDVVIDIWYSQHQEWIALESETRGGKLRYVVQ